MASGPKQIVLANLPIKEKERFFEFLVANNVEFVPRGDRYVASVRVVDAKGSQSNRSGSRRLSASKPRRVLSSDVHTTRSKSRPRSADSRAHGSPAVRQNTYPVPHAISMDVAKPKSKPGVDSKAAGHGETIERRSTSLMDLKMKYERFAGMLSYESGVNAMRRSQLLRLLDDLYESRFNFQLAQERACEESGGDAKPLSSFPAFVMDQISKHYGLRKITMKACWGMIAAVEMLRCDHVAIELFAKFLDESFDHSTDLVFYLNARHAAEAVVKEDTSKAPGNPKNQKKTEIYGTRLNAKQCIAIVRSLTKDESYAELRDRILQEVDATMVKLEAEESGEHKIEADRFLYIVTICYSHMRKEQEDAAVEDMDMDSLIQLGESDPDGNMLTSTRTSPIESAFKNMDPRMQMQVREIAQSLLGQLETSGKVVSKGEVYEWAIKAAVRSQSRAEMSQKDHSLLQGETKAPFDVSVAEVGQALSSMTRDDEIAPVVDEPRGCPGMMERDRILAMPAKEFEQNLEANVRKLLFAATQSLASSASKGLRADEAALTSALVDEFAPVADAMMEALVNYNFTKWLSKIKQQPPGNEEQRAHFEGLHADFTNFLNSVICASAVHEICVAVTYTPELEGLVRTRASELAEESVEESFGSELQVGRDKEPHSETPGAPANDKPEEEEELFVDDDEGTMENNEAPGAAGPEEQETNVF